MSLRPKDVAFFIVLVFVIMPFWLILVVALGGGIAQVIVDMAHSKPPKYSLPVLAVNLSLVIAFPFWIVRKWKNRLRAGRGVDSFGGPVVLYLRPFRSDRSIFVEYVSWWQQNMTPKKGNELPALESELGRVFGRLGRFVAVGRSDELLSREGASRFYPSDHEWQATVANVLKMARAVIIVAGTTKGVQWEFEQLRAYVDPRRVILVLPKAPLAVRRQIVAVVANALQVDFAKL